MYLGLFRFDDEFLDAPTWHKRFSSSSGARLLQPCKQLGLVVMAGRRAKRNGLELGCWPHVQFVVGCGGRASLRGDGGGALFALFVLLVFRCV